MNHFCDPGDSFPYEDLLHMERPVSEESLLKHPRMQIADRAKIFSPFAALQGHTTLIADEAGKTQLVPKPLLTEDEQANLSDQLHLLTEGTRISLLFFRESCSSSDPPLGKVCSLQTSVSSVHAGKRILFLHDPEDDTSILPIPMEDLVRIRIL